MLLGIMAVAFVPLFTMGFKLLSLDGQISKAQYSAQQAMESRLAGASPTNFPNVTPIETTPPVSITFGSYSITVPGTTVNRTYSNGKTKVSITAFVPN